VWEGPKVLSSACTTRAAVRWRRRSSVDGGRTWAIQQLAGPFRTSWFPLTTQGHMIGDYFSVSFVDGQAIPVFVVATEGTCERKEVTSCDVWTASATIPMG
jgi:hypothetical protein